MQTKDIKLVICRQNYENAENESSAVTSQHISININELPDINNIVLDTFKNDPFDMEIYDVNNVNDVTTWYFLKAKNSSNNYFSQVVVSIT